jgi:SAM-dependent methyltransferase
MFKKPPEQNPQIFNRKLLIQHRERAAADVHSVDFLFKEAAKNLADNLLDIKRDFPKVLNLSSHSGAMAGYLQQDFIIHQDLSAKMLDHVSGMKICGDEELIPIKEESLDLIISCLGLHWVNDLPGSFIQIKRSLKPDGMFMAAIFGGETLNELRTAFTKAEIQITGGLSPRISPFPDIKDIGALLQRAGFALPVVDMDRITVNYPDAFTLMKELRKMGESNILFKRSKIFSSKALMMEVVKNYQEIFANEQGRIPATFDILYISGWAPHESQQKPLKPGSATMNLADALGKNPPQNSTS